MALAVDGVKKAVNLAWDTNEIQGELCRLVARNDETGGVSNTNWSKNDGYGVLTYPLDYEGQTTVVVEGIGGGTETGTVKITADGAEIVDSSEPPEPVEPPETEEPPEIWGPPGPWIDVLPELPHVEHH